MAKIEISMKNAPSNTTMTVGEIFPDPRNNAPPTVNNVNVSAARSARQPLDRGSYTYTFHVDGDGGKFTLEIVGTGNPVSPTQIVDTVLGFSGWTFDFNVL